MLTSFQMFKSISLHQSMIVAMAKRDLQNRYIGTLGGLLWALIHPLAVIMIFYFVFAVGFRAQGPSGAPFILWFVCGLVPWFFFSETLTGMTNSITQNCHLVKKTVFPTEVLCFVNLLAGLFTHAVFLFLLMAMLLFFSVPFSVDRLLILYFLVCTCVLLLSLGWLLSALQVFYRDIAQGLSIVLNLCFWLTPIVWSTDIMPSQYRSMFFLNPMYYIVEGYRGMLVYDAVIWPGSLATVYFWSVTVALFLCGNYVFRRLKPEFADVM